jgi:hypothetical protein
MRVMLYWLGRRVVDRPMPTVTLREAGTSYGQSASVAVKLMWPLFLS